MGTPPPLEERSYWWAVSRGPTLSARSLGRRGGRVSGQGSPQHSPTFIPMPGAEDMRRPLAPSDSSRCGDITAVAGCRCISVTVLLMRRVRAHPRSRFLSNKSWQIAHSSRHVSVSCQGRACSRARDRRGRRRGCGADHHGARRPRHGGDQPGRVLLPPHEGTQQSGLPCCVECVRTHMHLLCLFANQTSQPRGGIEHWLQLRRSQHLQADVGPVDGARRSPPRRVLRPSPPSSHCSWL